MTALSVMFPPEWLEGRDWLFVETLLDGREEHSGSPVWAGGGVLDDGTNLVALRWTRGTNFARMSPETGWSIEERIAPAQPKPIRKLWQILIESMVRGKHGAEAETRAANERLAKAETDEEKCSAVLHHPFALRRAYEAYCETASDPVPFEVFELGLAIMAGEDAAA